jgi:hypothetical protein
MATTAKTGVYWPFKTILQGAGINLTETADTLQIATTGPGPGGGDMLISVYATNGVAGKVDHAVLADSATTVSHASAADSVPWAGITGTPTVFPTDWSTVQNKPAAFPTTWALVSGAPTVFPPAQHGATHLGNGGDPLPAASITQSGALPALTGSDGDYLDGTGVWANFNTEVATTALQRAGDSLTPKATLIGTADLVGNAAAWQEAPFQCRSLSNGGFGGIGFQCANFWACALGAYQTGLFIATSAGQFQQLTDTTGKIVGAALATGAAIANLGYTPISGSGGGTYTPTTPIILSKDVGLAATVYSQAPLRVQNVTTAGRPQIGFLIQGMIGVSLYLETDGTMRTINSGGSVARLFDSLHPIAAADMAAGAAAGNLGYTPVSKNGDSMTLGHYIFSQDLAPNPNAYQQAILQVTSATTNAGACAGIAFTNEGRVGIYLYLGNDGHLWYMNNSGAAKQIATL